MKRAIAAGALLGAAVLALLHVWRGLNYWNYSEGVYALTARMLLHGGDLYGHVVVAQPPWQFVFGAGALALHDSLGFLRLAVGVVQLATGVLGAVAVWRLTGNRWATMAAPALALLTPWAVHEHGTLTPEVLAPVLILAAALLATRRDRVPLAGVLIATTAFFKLPFAFAVIAVVLCSAAPWSAALWAAIALVVQAALFTALFGTGLWQDTVTAQLHSGQHTLSELGGEWAQAIWSLAGLVLLAALALWRRRDVRDQPLLRVLTGLAVALALTLATNTKQGTSLNVIVPIEAVLVPLALTGAVLANRAIVVVALVFTLAQSASLLASPRTALPFIYPTSARDAWGRAESTAQIKADAALARACPPGAPYSGPPIVGFVAHRSMPDGQPDGFLPFHSTSLAAVAARMSAAVGRCP